MKKIFYFLFFVLLLSSVNALVVEVPLNVTWTESGGTASGFMGMKVYALTNYTWVNITLRTLATAFKICDGYDNINPCAVTTYYTATLGNGNNTINFQPNASTYYWVGLTRTAVKQYYSLAISTPFDASPYLIYNCSASENVYCYDNRVDEIFSIWVNVSSVPTPPSLNIDTDLINNTEVTTRISETINFNGSLTGGYSNISMYCELLVNDVINLSKSITNITQNQQFNYSYGFIDDIVTFQINCSNNEVEDITIKYFYIVDTTNYYNFYLGLTNKAILDEVFNMIAELGMIILLIFGMMMLFYNRVNFILGILNSGLFWSLYYNFKGSKLEIFVLTLSVISVLNIFRILKSKKKLSDEE